MNILLAVHHFPPQRSGGAELQAYRTAHWLIERGHRVEVICVDSIAETPEGKVSWVDEVYHGIPVRRLSIFLPVTPQSLRLWFDHPLLKVHFESLLQERRPDLVHLISGYLMGVAPLTTAHQLGIRTVVTLTDFWFLCHTLQLLRGDYTLCPGPEPIECARCIYNSKRPFRWLDQRLSPAVQHFWGLANSFPPLREFLGLPSLLGTLVERRRILKETLGSVDAVITLAIFVAKIFAENGIKLDRHFLVRLPADVSIPAMAPNQRPQDGIHIGYLGQIIPVKGVDVLIRAFQLLDRSNHRARLTLYGPLDTDPTYVRHLRALAEGNSDIVFAGRYEHSKVMDIANGLDILVVPSLWYENGPHVILEAFAARVPVIGTDLGGISEFIVNEVNGLLVERKNPADLARQLQRVLDEPALLPRLRDGILPIRTVDQEMTELLDVYRHVLEKPAVTPARQQV